MADNFYRRICEELTAAGCTYVRQAKGSHEIWYSPLTGRTFTVPNPCKRRATANQIVKNDAGIGKKF